MTTGADVKAARGVWNIWTRVRGPFSRRTRNEFDNDTLSKLAMSDALYNRAALDSETLRLYHDMFSEPHDMQLLGQRFAQLVSALARQAGKPMLIDLPAMVVFLNEELRGFDTPEATEFRERAVLNEMRRLLKG
jgi:hypothetical protein